MDKLNTLSAEELLALVSQLADKVKDRRRVVEIFNHYYAQQIFMDDVARALLIELEAEHVPTQDMREQVACQIIGNIPDSLSCSFHEWRHNLINTEFTTI